MMKPNEKEKQKSSGFLTSFFKHDWLIKTAPSAKMTVLFLFALPIANKMINTIESH